MEIERHLGLKPLGDLDEVPTHRSAGGQLDRRPDGPGLRPIRRQPNAGEVLRGCPVLEQPKTLQGHQREIEVAVAVNIDRCGRASVVIVIETEDVGALDEPVG